SVILTGWMYNRFYTITVTLPTFPTRRSSDLHRGEASEHGRLLAYFREDPGASVLSDVVGDREGAIRSRALGVHTTLRDDLAIKVGQLFDQPHVLQEQGATRAGGHGVLVIDDRGAGGSGEFLHSRLLQCCVGCTRYDVCIDLPIAIEGF